MLWSIQAQHLCQLLQAGQRADKSQLIMQIQAILKQTLLDSLEDLPFA